MYCVEKLFRSYLCPKPVSLLTFKLSKYKAMKNITSLLVFVLSIQFTSATVRTLSGAGGAQYSDFGTAHNASSNGDTIMIEPFSGTYFVSTINKNLVFIGVGFN